MKEKIKNIKFGVIIFLVALVISIPLFWKNLDVYADDGSQHIIRGFLTCEALKKGESSTVLSRLSNGFGYSWNLFYGPISSGFIVLFNLISYNTIIAYKMVLFWGIFLSGIAMYLLVKRITNNKNIGVLSSILYMTMPYHLTDMYMRNALGEFLSYIFIPLVFLGLFNLFNKGKKDWLLVIGSCRININT